jgi:predicted metal-dependent hydrolase
MISKQYPMETGRFGCSEPNENCCRSVPELPSPIPNPDLDRGLNLFNRARFFDAHEALEDVWRAQPRASTAKKHLQGLVQLAVAFHHESRGNLRGARSVLDRALRNLNGAETSFPTLDLGQLRADVADWQKHLAGAVARPTLPQIAARKPTP